MSDIYKLPKLPQEWHWEFVSPCYTIVAVSDQWPYTDVTLSDGVFTVKGEEGSSQNVPAAVITALLSAHGVSL